MVTILVPRAHDPSGLWQGSRANTRSLPFTDFPSNLANLIGWEYDTNTLHILRKLDLARALIPYHKPEGSWALGMRMSGPLKFLDEDFNFLWVECVALSFSTLIMSKKVQEGFTQILDIVAFDQPCLRKKNMNYWLAKDSLQRISSVFKQLVNKSSTAALSMQTVEKKRCNLTKISRHF